MQNSMKFGLNIILTSVLVFSLWVPLARAENTAATNALSGAKTAAEGAYGDKNLSASMTDLPTAIGKIVGVALSLVGVAFLLLMIYGGFLWMFARGNDQDVSKAKELMQAAIIGLVIVLAAYAITSYVSTQLF